ncbi:MAG: patatin-like phospholipase family protein [Thermaerobacter sp.]|nr:patatin-like phospholipase family protein [Thermaerobacter sp.]
MGSKPKVALALGAGGIYGYAHIGVLQVLEEYGLRPDFVVGCSIGAVIGALYGAGLSSGQLETLGTHLRRSHWLDVTMTRMGVVSGQRLEGVLRLLTRDRRLEDLTPPLAVVATDIERGSKVVFTRGPAARAARASSAIPGIFSPVRLGEHLLVDGALVERVPVDTARALGADRVMAVALGTMRDGERVPVRHLFDVVNQSFDIMQRALAAERMLRADVLVEPLAYEVHRTSPAQASGLIEAGRNAATEKIEEIKLLFSREVAWHG